MIRCALKNTYVHVKNAGTVRKPSLPRERGRLVRGKPLLSSTVSYFTRIRLKYRLLMSSLPSAGGDARVPGAGVVYVFYIDVCIF
jgi:hypothetical protein